MKVSGAFATILAFLSAVTTACGAQVAPAPPPTPPDNVTLQLSWTHDFQFTPIYTAEANGHFNTRNLSVTLRQGGITDGKYIDAVEQVVNGNAAFGLTDGYNVLRARGNGKPLVAIAAIMQRSPSSLISLKSSNIRSPQDLIGKKVAFTPGSINWTYLTMLQNQGIDPSTIDLVNRSGPGVRELTDGTVDAMSGWFINEGVRIREMGFEPSFLIMGDYGTDTYPLVLTTTEAMIEQKPDVVRRMTGAILAGLKETLANPDAAVSPVLRYNPDLQAEGQKARLHAALPLFKPAGREPGFMQPDVWETTRSILMNRGIITQALKVESAYTTSFLK